MKKIFKKIVVVSLLALAGFGLISCKLYVNSIDKDYRKVNVPSEEQRDGDPEEGILLG